MNFVLKITFVALCAMLPAVSATKASLVDDQCKYNTYMCCWNKNDNGVEDNTDVCRGGRPNKRGVVREYPGDDEGDVHCHGIVWPDGASYEAYILPLYKFVRTFDHRDARGYYGRVKGSPQCECIEQMAVVTRADCSTYSNDGMVACKNNDLRTHYEGKMGSPRGNLDVNLLKKCDNE